MLITRLGKLTKANFFALKFISDLCSVFTQAGCFDNTFFAMKIYGGERTLGTPHFSLFLLSFCYLSSGFMVLILDGDSETVALV